MDVGELRRGANQEKGENEKQQALSKEVKEKKRKEKRMRSIDSNSKRLVQFFSFSFLFFF